MATHAAFNEDAVIQAIELAKLHHEAMTEGRALNTIAGHEAGELAIAAGCVSITVENGKVCVELPLNIGKFCFPVPNIPDGTVGQACIDICTHLGIPTGVKLTVTLLGRVIFQKSFLWC